MSQNRIEWFKGKYDFLSNFYICDFVYKDIQWNSSEAAFQAQKTTNEVAQMKISHMSPSDSKKACGRYGLKDFKIVLRPDWEDVKDNYMYEILVEKFSQNQDLKEKLLATGDAYLEEGTMWHDNYWGNCHCSKCSSIPGKNMLGKTLMKVRETLKNQQ